MSMSKVRARSAWSRFKLPNLPLIVVNLGGKTSGDVLLVEELLLKKLELLLDELELDELAVLLGGTLGSCSNARAISASFPG